MTKHLWLRQRLATCAMGVFLLASMLGLATLGRQTRAADLAEQAHSLRSVPADAAYYSASLRLKEQLDIFLESKAYAKLLQIPLIQFAKMTVESQWQQSPLPGVKEFREYFESP